MSLWLYATLNGVGSLMHEGLVALERMAQDTCQLN